MTRLRRIGILGGMGPEATVLLMSRLIRAVPAGDDADHIPLIVDQNSQVPSRIAHLLEDGGTDPGPELAAMAARLVGAGAEALAIACNTAHHYAPAIRATAPDLPFLDMVALTAQAARDLAGPGAKVGMLASPALRRIGLYDAALKAAGLTVLYPQAQEPEMLAAIRRIKASGADKTARAALKAASAALLDQGAEVQIIACTEFSTIPDALAPGVRSIDALDVLVGAIIRFARSGE